MCYFFGAFAIGSLIHVPICPTETFTQRLDSRNFSKTPQKIHLRKKVYLTLPKTNIAMENPPFWWYLQGNIGIFMGYVSFREGSIFCCLIFFFGGKLLILLFPRFFGWEKLRFWSPQNGRSHFSSLVDGFKFSPFVLGGWWHSTWGGRNRDHQDALPPGWH